MAFQGQSADPSDYLQADFTFLVGASFADPDHPAALGAGHVFIEDKFDYWTTPKIETSAQSEAFSRMINDEAGESLRGAIYLDDQAGASLRHHPGRAAALGDRKAGHSSIPALR